MTDHSVQVITSALTKTLTISRKSSLALRWGFALLLCLAWLLAPAFTAQAEEISSDTIRLHLSVSPEGIPIIKDAIWIETGETAFTDLGTPDGLAAWVPAALLPADAGTPATWTITDGDHIITAEASRDLANKLRITWVVELPKEGQLFRAHVRLSNLNKKARAVDTFPAWTARWDIAESSPWVRSFQSLAYTATQQTLTSTPVRLGSRLHSSDDAAKGVTPYWVVGGNNSRVYFGLQWSGGWSASINSLGNGFLFSAGLPSTETQLVLGKNQTIEGPMLLVTPMRGADEAAGRGTWMRQRRALGKILYGGPSTSFLLTYNHWYAVRQQINADFVNRQIAAMSPFTFDAFILDAGWFADGRWKPDPAKFKAKNFVQTLASLKAGGVKPGLWTTPQFVSDSNNAFGLTIEQPEVTNRFLGGSLVDMSGSDFTNYLLNHVQTLRNKYSMDYWKYDQPFFTDQTRAGEMKNVLGFQNSIIEVRKNNPDLVIENCFDGGRMLNEFTLLATQTSWLKDAGTAGMPDPQDNISTALNALSFVFPWAALRFTLNFEHLDPNDDEMTRLYCRSAMAGTWGLSTDLTALSANQKAVILQEIQNYRRLNRDKFSCIYDLQPPSDGADVAGVSYYSGRTFGAGVLVYRWQRQGAFDQHIALTRLKPELTYHVVDVDTGTSTTGTGSDLMANGLTVPFSSTRLSALIFVDPVDGSSGKSTRTAIDPVDDVSSR
jgi:hypothetical protein